MRLSLKIAMVVVCLVAAAFGMAQPALGQAGGTHLWSKDFGSTNIDWGQAVTVDRSGNIIATGCFGATSDPGNVTGAQCDLFVAKFSGTTGEQIWSKRFGGTASEYAFAVAVDNNGDIFLTGWFGNTIDFGGGPLTSAGLQDIFLVKLLGTTGEHVWSKRFGGAGDDDYGHEVAVDSNGDVVIVGTIRNATVDFGGGPLTTAGGSDAFVAKFSGTNGAHLWSKRFGGVTNEIGRGVALDSGNNVVAAGGFSSTVDFGGGPISSAGEYDGFVVKLSADTGGLLWVKRLGGSDNDYGHAVAVDSDGNVVVTGTFNGTADFGGGPLTSAGTCSYYYGDIFLVKLGPSGSHLWSERFGSAGCDSGESIAVDSGGNVFVTGYFQGTVDFGGGPLASAGNYEILLAKYASADGSHLWSKRFGSSDEDRGYYLAVDGSDNVVLTGSFRGTVDFGGGPLPSQGASDAFVAKFLGGVPGPAVSLIPPRIDFGNQLVGTTSAAQSILLRNSGNAALTLSGISLTGLDPAEFTQANNCAATLSAGGTCTIDVTFSPGSTGIKSALLSIASDAPGSPHVVTLSGNGTVPAPAVNLAPTGLNFGNQLVDSTSAAQSVTLTNSGTATLNIVAISMSGADSSQFGQVNDCANSLAPSASCTISVTFSPTTPGAKSGGVMIDSDSAGSPHLVPLTGNGTTPPDTSLSVTSLTFSAQIMNTSSTPQIVSLTNTGGSPLSIASLSITGAGSGDFSKTDNCGAVLDAAASCTINVTFRPSAAGNCSAEVTIQHNAAGGVLSVSLSGMGTDFSIAPQAGSPSSATVTAGQAATYQLNLAGTSGFNGTATLACTGAPTAATCNVSPNSATLNGTTPVAVTVTVSTTARSSLPPMGRLRQPHQPIPVLPLLALLLMASLWWVAKQNARMARAVLGTSVLAAVLFAAACGGGDSAAPLPRGTPVGTYTITVTTSTQQGSQTANRNISLTLVVQ